MGLSSRFTTTLVPTTGTKQSILPVSSYSNDLNHFNEQDTLNQLDPETMNQLEQENETLLQELLSSIDHVQTATQSIQEISNLQAQLSHHLQEQQESIQTLFDDAWKNTVSVFLICGDCRGMCKVYIFIKCVMRRCACGVA